LLGRRPEASSSLLTAWRRIRQPPKGRASHHEAGESTQAGEGGELENERLAYRHGPSLLQYPLPQACPCGAAARRSGRRSFGALRQRRGKVNRQADSRARSSPPAGAQARRRAPSTARSSPTFPHRSRRGWRCESRGLSTGFRRVARICREDSIALSRWPRHECVRRSPISLELVPAHRPGDPSMDGPSQRTLRRTRAHDHIPVCHSWVRARVWRAC
jgi:hypothetical protein